MTMNYRTAGTRILVAIIATACLGTLGTAPSYAVDPAPSPTPGNSPQSTLAEVDVTITGNALDVGAIDTSPQDHRHDIGGASSKANAPLAPSMASPAGTSTNCWDVYVTHSGKNLVGGTLFSVTTHTAWCGDGTTIKTKATTTTTHTTAFGWTYEGLEQNYNKWGVGYTKFYSMRQAQFCLLNCLAGNSLLTNQPLVGPSGQVYSY